MPTLGENIQRFRKMRGFSQTELAGRIPSSQQAVCRYERDQTEPPLYIIWRIAVILSVSPYEILKGVFENYYREADKGARNRLQGTVAERGGFYGTAERDDRGN